VKCGGVKRSAGKAGYLVYDQKRNWHKRNWVGKEGMVGKPINHRIILAERPVNRSVMASDFSLDTAPIPEPGPGQVLVRGHWLSLDPYMRGRMSAAKSYAAKVQIGDVMVGEGIGEVIATNGAGPPPGTLVLAPIGWQEYATVAADAVKPIEPGAHPPSYFLGILGMPGMTAYFALLDIGRPQPGETVVVSAAAGAVGQVVGQIAKLRGCRVIGIAGRRKKIAYLRDELNFDAVIDYRDKPAKQLAQELAEVAPDGIDVYFDNVGGVVHDAAMLTLADHARIIICGVISTYDHLESIDFGPRWMRQLLIKRARMEGFLISDYAARRGEFLAEMGRWLDQGLLKYREDVTEGLAEAPAAFIGMLAGRNLGKTLVRIAP